MGALTILAGLALMIVIHEGAHFAAAKAFNMKATEAFFGFGPRLWSTTRGETEYGIKAIPFGGYVRIIGMNPFEEVPVEEEGRTEAGRTVVLVDGSRSMGVREAGIARSTAVDDILAHVRGEVGEVPYPVGFPT